MARKRKNSSFSTNPHEKLMRLSKSSIIDLPVELLEGVAEYLCLEDVCSIRIACKELSTKLLGPFVKTFFTDRCFLLSDWDSMSTLLKMSDDRTCTKYMRCLRFSTDILDREKMRRAQNIDAARWYEHREEEFIREGGLIHTLNLIFERLRQTGVSLHISFVPGPFTDCDDQRTCLPFGLKGLRERFQLQPGETIMTASTASYFGFDYGRGLNLREYVYEAVLHSKFAARGLEIGTPNILDKDEIGLPWFSSAAAGLSTTNLRVLDLYLSLIVPRSPANALAPSQTQRRYIRDFIAFIARARNLEELVVDQGPHRELGSRISADNELYRQTFHSIATKSYLDGRLIEIPLGDRLLPKLKSLKLAYHLIHFELLLDFVRQRKETLRSISLDHVTDYSEVKDGPDRIREAANATSDNGFTLGWIDSYSRYFKFRRNYAWG